MPGKVTRHAGTHFQGVGRGCPRPDDRDCRSRQYLELAARPQDGRRVRNAGEERWIAQIEHRNRFDVQWPRPQELEKRRRADSFVTKLFEGRRHGRTRRWQHRCRHGSLEVHARGPFSARRAEPSANEEGAGTAAERS
jgi:hypothetical protein